MHMERHVGRPLQGGHLNWRSAVPRSSNTKFFEIVSIGQITRSARYRGRMSYATFRNHRVLYNHVSEGND